MRTSIRTKLTTAMLVLVGVAMLAVMGIAAVVLTEVSQKTSDAAQAVSREAIAAALERQGQSLAETLSNQLHQPLERRDRAAVTGLLADVLVAEDVASVRIIDPEGYLFADGSPSPEREQILQDPLEPESVEFADLLGTLRIRKWILTDDGFLGQIQLELKMTHGRLLQQALSTAVSEEQASGLKRLVQTALTVTVILLAVAVVASRKIGMRFTEPIEALHAAADRVARGDLTARVDVRSDDELGELASSFNTMVQEVETARTNADERARMSHELELAANLQLSLLPPSPAHPDFRFAGRMKPADEVGGDFYDVLPGPDNALWITIGDVSSHGLGAGIVMMLTQSAYGALFQADPRMSPDEAYRHVNRRLSEALSERLKDNKYVTGLLMTYRGNGRFLFVGGHEWPLVLRRDTGKVERVEAVGPWIGIVPELPEVPVHELTLRPGDIMCLYSDGIIEAATSDGEQFDLDRLEALFEAEGRRGAELEAVADHIMGEVAAFATVQDDDQTLLLVEYRKTDPASA